MIALYVRNIGPSHARPEETAQRAEALLSFFGDKMLCELNGTLCREYAKDRLNARRQLEDLRAAVKHHRKEGLCSQVFEVVLPPRGESRERWLTRKEAAALVRAAWRSPRHRHIARFILVALYTGTRASLVCGAALGPMLRSGYVDLDTGLFYRKPAGAAVTKKRAPTIPLPAKLLAHLRRWQRCGQRFVVEYQGEPVIQVKKGFRFVRDEAGLGDDVTPHTLRHTCATWLMQQGTDLWEAAGYLGMTVEMLNNRYGHHHPAHLKGATDAFDKRKR